MRIIDFLIGQNKLNRSWTIKETEKYGIMNDELIKELNQTLTPSTGEKTGKIGCFLFGQAGDLITATSVLKYIDVLFPNKEIIWFANFPNADALKYSNVSEVRRWPWSGNHLPVGCPDYDKFLCNSENQLKLDIAKDFEDTKDLQNGFFPAPHMIPSEKQDGIDYTDCSKMIFGVPKEWEWKPVLNWSAEEEKQIHDFVMKLPEIPFRKTILMETFCGSGQSCYWDEFTTKKIMAICREKLGPTNFIFASHKHKGGPNNEGLPHDMFIDEEGVVSAAHFTVRQAGLLINYCDLMVCMSSGVSCATSAWGLKPVKKLQYCGSKKCSTVGIANGPIELVTTDGKSKEVADTEFYQKLSEVLETI